MLDGEKEHENIEERLAAGSYSSRQSKVDILLAFYSLFLRVCR